MTASPVKHAMPALLALTMASFIATANESVPAGLLPAIAAGLQVSEAGAGQLVTACAFGSGLAAIPLAACTAQRGRRSLLLAALAIFLIGNLLTAATGSYVMALGARFLIGLATGLTWTLLAGYARRLASPGEQGRAMALAMAGIALALALGMPMGSWLGGWLGWRSVFLLLAVMSAVLIAWVYALVPEVPAEPQARGLRQALSMPGVASILAILAAWIFAHYLLYTYIAPVLAWLGYAPLLERILLLFGVCAVAGNGLVGRFIDRNLRRLVLACLAIFAATAAGLALLPASTLLVYAATALWGLSFGGAPTLLQTALADRAGAHANSAQSVLVTVFNLAFAASGAAGGVLLKVSTAAVLPLAVAALALLTIALAARGDAIPSSRF